VTQHFAIFFAPGFAFATSLQVAAERHEVGDGKLRFYVDDRLVYQAPAEHVVRVEAFATQAEAEACLRQSRGRRHGAASLHVAEGAAPPSPRPRPGPPQAGGSGFAESVSIRLAGSGDDG
jgi:hypothetical protein